MKQIFIGLAFLMAFSVPTPKVQAKAEPPIPEIHGLAQQTFQKHTPLKKLSTISPVVIKRAIHPGNTYTPGNCTWYVKSRRSDIPNSLGNANTWYYRAKNLGLSTGLTARQGAVGVSLDGPLGHVVYVERVSGNQMIISEMNFVGLYRVSGRTIPTNGWFFIY